MRSYCGVYVDAGYLYAAASVRLTGTSYRAATEMDVAALLDAIVEQVTCHAKLPLLRVHWYDAARGATPSMDQRRIATLPRVKLRLGRTSVNGEQKGVDLKLALDLITQARHRVMDVVYLVSGDDDLTEAVEEAQHLGTQVALLAVPDLEGRPIHTNKNLQMACDELLLVSPAALDEHVRRATPPARMEPEAPVEKPVAVPAPPPRFTPADLAALSGHRAPAAMPPRKLVVTTDAVPVYSSITGQASRADPVTADVEAAITQVVDSLLGSLSSSPGGHQELMARKPMIPPDLDRTLLLDLVARLHVDELDTAVRFRLRDAFWERVPSVP